MSVYQAVMAAEGWRLTGLWVVPLHCQKMYNSSLLHSPSGMVHGRASKQAHIGHGAARFPCVARIRALPQ